MLQQAPVGPMLPSIPGARTCLWTSAAPYCLMLPTAPGKGTCLEIGCCLVLPFTPGAGMWWTSAAQYPWGMVLPAGPVVPSIALCCRIPAGQKPR